jgi:hypothetical protein
MDIQTAERLARQKAGALWPEFSGVRPSVARRERYAPSAGTLSRLNMPYASSATPEGDDYTFTFRKEMPTPEGHRLLRVARVTVNTAHGVVKATVSK